MTKRTLPTPRFCPCCDGKLVTQTKIIERMGRRYWKGDQLMRERIRVSIRIRVCKDCQIRVVISSLR